MATTKNGRSRTQGVKAKKSKARRGSASVRGKVRPRGTLGAEHVPMDQLAGAPARAADILHEAKERSEAKPPVRSTGSKKTDVTAPVELLLHEARELFDNARRLGRKLAKAGLDERYLKELPQRIALVADAQRAWERQRVRSAPAALKKARGQAAQLKTDMLAAGRYLLRHDRAAQRELDQIAEGDGSLRDLIGDLHTLARFYETRADALRNADVPPDAVTRARDLAVQLEAVGVNPDELHLLEHRNRAMAMLDEAVTEVRAAGRYVFRRMPAKLSLFRQEMRRAAAKRRALKTAS